MAVSDREQEMAQVILMLIKDNRDDLRDLTKAVASLTAAVSAMNERIASVEETQRGDGHIEVTLARLESRVTGELTTRPTYRQFIGAMAAGITLATAIATVVVGIIGVAS